MRKLNNKGVKKQRESNSDEFEIIVCPICDWAKYKIVYQCHQETGNVLGRILTSFVICDCCGFMYQNPRPRPEFLVKHYSESEEASGSVYHDKRVGSYHLEKQKSRREFYLKHLDTITKGSLLEVGCSTGDYLLSLGLTQWNLTGLEPSVKAANEAKACGLDIICSSLEDSNLEDESYDVICCFSVLEHLHDINSAIQVITDKLKFNGQLCLEVPDSMKPVPQIAEFFTFEHMSHFTKETLMFFLRGYGYSDFEFDNNVSDARLRLVARKKNNGLQVRDHNVKEDKNKLSNDSTLLIAQINNYKNAKNLLKSNISDRLSSSVQRWKLEHKRVAIYGAGIHTRYLLNLFDLSENVTAIIDSDLEKQGNKFLRWTISGEALLANGKVDAVIISSKAFEDEIYNRIKKYLFYSDIEIVCCYRESR